MIRERCSCGAEIETDSDGDYDIVVEWRDVHKCIPVIEQSTVSGFAQVETAPDYVLPELHIGFRAPLE